MIDFSSCYTVLHAVNDLLAVPTIMLFLSTAIILTLKTRCIQIRAIPRFAQLLSRGIQKGHTGAHTISPVRALFSAMATTLGMGNIVGPSMAISIGGPGALFWMVLYIILGSVTKYTEVSFAVYSRTTSPQGNIIGGPSQYLALITPSLGRWYAGLTILLFTCWSSIQVNTLSCIWAQEGVPTWMSGLVAVSILLGVVLGGVDRIGYFASRAVPLKFMLYVGFALLILMKNYTALVPALAAIWQHAFSGQAVAGGALGLSAFMAMREGIYKSIFITEAGLGTSSIPHALANVEYPSDQGILALYSGLADMLLCVLSGLLTLVTGVWLLPGKLNNTLIYEAFKMHAIPGAQYALMVSILLFVITALIGNTYNGSQSFAAWTRYRFVKAYYLVAAGIAFSGSLMAVPFIWNLMDIILVMVAVPNLLGLLYLAFKYPHIMEY
jgi:AGCS family alanine or glycine:cation symporter